MSEQDVEIVRRLMASVQGGPLEPALAVAHPEIEFDARVRPDGKVWHGPEGVAQAMLEWTGMWSDWMIIQAVLIVLGGLLVWALIAGIIAEHFHDRRTGHPKH